VTVVDRAPLFRFRPPITASLGDLAVRFAREQLGLDPDPEQVWLLETIYAEKSPGVPVCFEVDVVAPRQNIKSSTFLIAAMFDLFVLRVPLGIWTAHEFKTARKSFEDMKRRIARNPDLASRCTIRDSHGEERITLHTGESLEFHARSGGSGRGFTCDRLTLDEGLFLEPADMGAILPTLATIAGAQVRVGSSAGKLKSAVLRSIRDTGRAGSDPGQGYVEYGAPFRECDEPSCVHQPDTPGCALDDRDLWWQASSALWVGRITEERIERFRKRLPPREFAREFLSWWEDPPDAAGGAIPVQAWEKLVDSTEMVGRPSFAVATAPDRSWSAISAAWQRADGHTQVELVDYHAGASWVTARADALRERWGVQLLATTAARGLVRDAVEPSQSEQAQAHNALADAVGDSTVRHGNQPALNVAVSGARWRAFGDTRVLDRKGTTDISPIDAAAVALWDVRRTRVADFYVI
jgi:hypothetical protein